MKKYILSALVFFGICNSQILLAQESKFTHHTEVGILPYNLSFQEIGVTVQTFNGYRLNPDLAIGATVSYDKYSVDDGFKYSVLPVSLGIRYDFLEPKSTRMFAGLDAGYGFAWETDAFREGEVKGGLRFNPEVGMKWKLGEGKFFMTLALGYQYQHFKAEYTSFYFRPFLTGLMDQVDYYYSPKDYVETKDINAHRFSFKIGFGF